MAQESELIAEESKLIGREGEMITLNYYKAQRELLMRKEVVMKMLDYQIPQNFNGDDVAILTELRKEKGEYVTRAGHQLKILILDQQVDNYNGYKTKRNIHYEINARLSNMRNKESSFKKKYKYELDRPEREAAELRTKEGHERVEAALEEGRRRQEAYKKKMGITIGGSLKKTKKNKKY